MGLEKYLAEIEVISKEIVSSASDELRGKDDFYSYLKAITHEARILEDSSRKVRKEFKKYEMKWDTDKHKSDKTYLNKYLGDSAKTAKNLADNLSRFMQTIYSNSKIELYNLKINTENAPKLDTGESLYDFFVKIHDHDKENPWIKIRNEDGHGNGYGIFDTILLGNKCSIDYEWVDKTSKDYLKMVAACLRTIVDKDTDNFEKIKYDRKRKIMRKRIGNFIDRHKKPVITVAASALLAAGIAGGVIGNQAWQNYQEKERLRKELSELDLSGFIRGRISTMGPELQKHSYDLANEIDEKQINKLIKEHIDYWGDMHLNKENYHVKQYLENHPDALKKQSEYEKVVESAVRRKKN